eukprot:scaffold6832_cov143-Skeletonema_dohrnii-CCMP3373.AAC.1
MGPRQPFSPHPPADLPLPSGRTLRRRNTYTYKINDEGGGGGGTTSTDDGDGEIDPSHSQLHLSPVSHFHPPQKHEHPDNNLLPLAAPYSPVRRQFGNEHYMSPGRPTPAAAAHSPYAVTTDTEEAKMKATRDDETKDL